MVGLSTTKERRVLLIIVLAAGAFATGGCQTSTVAKRPDKWERVPSTARVVLMTPDIELAELTAGGVLEPNVERTQKATRFVADALQTEIGTRNAHLTPYQAPADDTPRTHEVEQLVKLHEVVGNSLLVHHYGPLRLPNKAGKFDWSLGETAKALGEDAGADYALFVFVRDSYASAGRKAAMVGVAVLSLGRVVLSGGVHQAFASLVDLKTGDIVWFNRLIDTQADVREPDPARSAVKKLLSDFPL